MIITVLADSAGRCVSDGNQMADIRGNAWVWYCSLSPNQNKPTTQSVLYANISTCFCVWETIRALIMVLPKGSQMKKVP